MFANDIQPDHQADDHLQDSEHHHSSEDVTEMEAEEFDRRIDDVTDELGEVSSVREVERQPKPFVFRFVYTHDCPGGQLGDNRTSCLVCSKEKPVCGQLLRGVEPIAKLGSQIFS